MYTRSALLFTLLVVLRIGAVAQSYQVSLLRVWNNTSLPDTSRLAAAQKLIWRVYLQRSPDTARYYAEEQLKLAQRSGLLKQESSAYNNIGVTYHIEGDLERAIPYYQLSLDVDVKRAQAQPGDVQAVTGIASSHVNIGVLHQQLGNVPSAMAHYERALHLLDSLEGKGVAVNAEIANVQNNIGLAHETQKSSADALLWFRRAEERYAREEPSTGSGNTLGNIGNALQRLAVEADRTAPRDSLMGLALQYYDRSFKAREELDDRRGMANSLNNIGSTLQQQANWASDAELRRELLQQAEKRFRQSASMAEAVDDRQSLAGTWANIAENLLLQDRLVEAMHERQPQLTFDCTGRSGKSTGSPSTFSTRPSVSGPTGTWMGALVSMARIPRCMPSVGFMATARTRPSPRCCCTSTTTSIASVVAVLSDTTRTAL